MDEQAFQINGVPHYPAGDIQTVLEKLQRQLEANNPEAAKVLIYHCIEKLNKGDVLCDPK